jgi:uncharacterized FlaG/YvyC family protein
MIEVINKNINSTDVYDNDEIVISYNSDGKLEIKIFDEDSDEVVRIILGDEESRKIINFCQQSVTDVIPF